MNILYVSTLCSQKTLEYIYKTSIVKPRYPAQKFHSLIVKGIAKQAKDIKLSTLTSLPVTPSLHNRKLWNLKEEKEEGVTYKYIPLVNVKFFKNIGVFFYTLLKVFFWGLFNRKKGVLICDFLNLTIASASLISCKITGVKIIAIATDMPGLMVSNSEKKSRLIKAIYNSVNKIILYRFSGYIMLTKYMQKKINPQNHPYMIMEGLVDINMKKRVNDLKSKSKDRILIYAGGLHEKYGIKTLLEAFTKLEEKDLKLYLYGGGSMDEIIKEFEQQDSRISYFGMQPNELVVQKQLEATLLINPRPTSEEFTLYSFPSKNMEYMVSGTPMITTRLPGMPDEYLDYVKLFEDETVEGMYLSLKEVLSCSRGELHNLGIEAKSFVLKFKNNEEQGKRILNFIKSLGKY